MTEKIERLEIKKTIEERVPTGWITATFWRDEITNISIGYDASGKRGGVEVRYSSPLSESGIMISEKLFIRFCCEYLKDKRILKGEWPI